MSNVHLSDQYLFRFIEVIKVCKCMKNVFVQCELWCDEILRRVARPCCSCSQPVSAQLLHELASSQRMRAPSGSSRMFAPGISLSTCPSRLNRGSRLSSPQKCPAPHPTPDCLKGPTTSYLMYGSSYDQIFGGTNRNTATSSSDSARSESRAPVGRSKRSSTVQSLLNDIHSDNMKYLEGISFDHIKPKIPEKTSQSYHTPDSTMFTGTSQDGQSGFSFKNFPTTMFANIQMSERPPTLTQAKSGYSSRKFRPFANAFTLFSSILFF